MIPDILTAAAVAKAFADALAEFRCGPAYEPEDVAFARMISRDVATLALETVMPEPIAKRLAGVLAETAEHLTWGTRA